ncbi:MAG: hypothetical protein ACXWBN_11130, partial [Acidimicrobiales bacterium]
MGVQQADRPRRFLSANRPFALDIYADRTPLASIGCQIRLKGRLGLPVVHRSATDVATPSISRGEL